MRWIGMVAMAVAGLVFWLGQGAQERSEDGGYLVLALSWSPSWCAAEGDARGDARCAPGAGTGWLVHGLWPQHEAGGWPEFCDTAHPPPDRRMTGAMEDIMGSAGLARHQWTKHGSCSGLSPAAYFDRTRAAFAALTFPETIRARDASLRLAPDAVLAAFRAANPAVAPDMVVLTCRQGNAQEIRLCLSRDLRPRPCDPDLLSRGCRAGQVTLPAKP